MCRPEKRLGKRHEYFTRRLRIHSLSPPKFLCRTAVVSVPSFHPGRKAGALTGISTPESNTDAKKGPY